MRDISSDLKLLMKSENCTALLALLLICSNEDYSDVIFILQSESGEESSG